VRLRWAVYRYFNANGARVLDARGASCRLRVNASTSAMHPPSGEPRPAKLPDRDSRPSRYGSTSVLRLQPGKEETQAASQALPAAAGSALS
jgi:hypothetical protein